jgi:prepilin-type N-terminal cleavage/methylation domain-containing protein
MTLLRRLRRQGGYSLIELVVVMVILLAILGALTTIYVQGSRAELDLNKRFRAQIDAGVALDRLRRDVHCADDLTPTGAAASITLTLPAQCTGAGTISWCTVGSGTRYALYRASGSTCDATAKLYADYLTSGTVFDYTAPVAGTSLGKLHVDLPVNVDPTRSVDRYELIDDIVLRNTSR